MSNALWNSVDRYITDQLVSADPVLDAVLASSVAAGLPAINVAPNQGKMLHLFAHMLGAKNILEIGTLGGYSTIWMARALPSGGRLVTLECDAKHADVARANFAKAGLVEVIELRLGMARDTLVHLAAENRDPFDLIFIDADKPSTPEYFASALKLARRGSLIVVDNVVRSGGVADSANTDASVQGVRRFYDLIANEPRVSATAIQTVGTKGYDGFAMVLVNGC